MDKVMDKIHKDILKITKEIVVKFVEVGRITPANFAESFPAIYTVVRETLTDNKEDSKSEAFLELDASGVLRADATDS